MKNSIQIFLIYFLIFSNSNIHAQYELLSDIFPLEIGNKWYYQRGTNTSECYAIIKEVTDTLSNGFREITGRYLYRNFESIGKEYWGFIDGKFYSNTSPQIENSKIFYNAFLTHDSCTYIAWSYGAACWHLTEFQIFNITDSAQIYTRDWALASIVSGVERVITSPQIGIASTWAESYPRYGEGIRDSTRLIGMYHNGELLGDSIFYNPYRASTPLSPWDGSLGMFLTVKLQWSVASEVVSYKVQVSKDSGFSNLLVDSAGIKDTFIVVGPLENFTEYYWRVSTLSSDGKEYWSSYFIFKTIDTKNIPYLILPENGAYIAQRFTFKWKKAEEGISYGLQISTDSLFNNIYKIVLEYWNLTDTIKIIDPLNLNTKYFWRIKASTIDYQSTSHEFWSQVFSFIVTDFDNLKTFILYQNYPNPFNLSTKISYTITIPKSSFVTLKVFDVLGREVATLVNEEKPMGNYAVVFSGSELPSGIYFYQLQSGSFMETKKLLVLK